MTQWRIWIEVAENAHAYLGEAEAETFAEACLAYVAAHAEHQDDFDITTMTLRGCRLVALDRRRDGVGHIFATKGSGGFA